MTMFLAAMAAADLPGWWNALTGQYGANAWKILQIVWIDIVLAGDNAVVIALACRSLPANQRTMGIVLGALVAVLLRIVFTVVVQSLLGVPWLKAAGGVLLFWIAIKLLIAQGLDENKIQSSSSLWKAVQIVAVADMVMSLDNVLAIAAAARGETWLIVLGLVISIPLVVYGATLVTGLLNRFPILVWAGAALLGWIAGELIATDVALVPHMHAAAKAIGVGHYTFGLICAGLGATVVVIAGRLLSSGRDKRNEAAPLR